MDLTAAPSRVLVVDDDETVSSLFARILSREGYTVETAANRVDLAGRVTAPQNPVELL